MRSPSVTSSHLPVTILAVVVLYRQTPMESKTIQTLCAAIDHTDESDVRVQVLICDNTPGGQWGSPRPEAFRYRAYENNPGLAKPYNDAFQADGSDSFDWLLTLDQDTTLPLTFLTDIACVARSHQTDGRIAAIVPHIVDGDRHISPFRYIGGFLPVVVPIGADGICGSHTSAINSASLLRISSLKKVGGYDEELALHNTDTRLFQQLHQAGLRVVVAGAIVVPHQLAILQRESRMSVERYRKTLSDERFFYDSYMGLLGHAERFARLIGRYIKGFFSRENEEFQKVTAKEIWIRMTTARRPRTVSRVALSNSRTGEL